MDIYAHVLDQNGKNGTTNSIPIRYANNTTDYHTTNNIPQCTSDYSITSGGTLYSGTKITNQYSCKPYSDNPGLNVGNYYSFPAATAGSDTHSATSSNNIEAPNSICPKGWQLPPNSDNKSYNNLIRTAYNISTTTSDSQILASPLSFVRLGFYYYDYGSLNDRGSAGYYWSSTAYSSVYNYYLYFHSRSLNHQTGDNRARGLSIRCVSR